MSAFVSLFVMRRYVWFHLCLDDLFMMLDFMAMSWFYEKFFFGACLGSTSCIGDVFPLLGYCVRGVYALDENEWDGT